MFTELAQSFSPDLLFERDRPEVLFPRHLNMNSPTPEAYAQAAPGTPPEWWSACVGEETR